MIFHDDARQPCQPVDLKEVRKSPKRRPSRHKNAPFIPPGGLPLNFKLVVTFPVWGLTDKYFDSFGSACAQSVSFRGPLQ
jgi:hypothetical protein